MTAAVDILVAERHKHYFVKIFSGTCSCGYEGQTSVDWDQHVAQAQLNALADWMDTFTSPLIAGELNDLASAWASRRLREGEN